MSIQGWSIFLGLLAAFDWIVFLALGWLASKHRWPALTERALVSLAIAGGVTFAAALGLNILVPLGMSPEARFAFLLASVIVPSLANVAWVGMALSGKFRENER